MNKNVHSDENSRQADVLRDILDKNGECKHVADQKAQRLKAELKGYRNMSKSIRRMLSEMGFVITEQGKHYKLTYYGDPRYWTTLAKTSSDDRAGKNAALTIINKMF